MKKPAPSFYKRLLRIEDFEPLIGAQVVERILKKARSLSDLSVVHLNSTYYGGGVAALLSSLTQMMNMAGVKTGWRVLQGAPDFFAVTKKLHNALQGERIDLTPRKKLVYEQTVYENSVRNHLDQLDRVMVHDPQPLPIIRHYRRRGPWIWRCHLDVSRPDPATWSYVKPFMDSYDAAIFSLPEYGRRDLKVPLRYIAPAVDPFSLLNRDLKESEIDERLERHGIPTDLPIVTQISRFDRWKDPVGVIDAFNLVRRRADATLVLLGNMAGDDPEGAIVFEEMLKRRDDRVLIISAEDSGLVNALQRRAAVVVQKSIREGFGLTVTEAMWKGAAVVGGNVGGIRRQIRDGVNGFLVSSIEETADRILRLLKDARLRRRMGASAKETVRRHFLLSRYLEEELDLLGSFEYKFRLAK
jgi:trehalose synthase